MGEYKSLSYDEIQVGDKASMTKKITDEIVRDFAEVSSDSNPIHVDDEFAKNSLFGQRIAHGMIGASLISAVVGTKLPGIDTIYVKQDLQFTAPVFIGDEITAEVEITGKKDEKHLLFFKTIVKNQDGKEVIVGEGIGKKQ